MAIQGVEEPKILSTNLGSGDLSEVGLGGSAGHTYVVHIVRERFEDILSHRDLPVPTPVRNRPPMNVDFLVAVAVIIAPILQR